MAASRLCAVAHSVYLSLLAESAGRDTPDAPRGSDTCSWLGGAERLSVGRVRRDLAAAAALDPQQGELRTLGVELAAGRVTPEHTRIAVRALELVPAAIRRERQKDLDGLLTDHATRFAPPITRTLARHLLDTLDPARTDRFDTEAHLRRQLHLGVDSTGMGVLRAQLEPAATAQLKAVLDHLSAPHRANPTAGDTARDERTPAQRRADALGEMARLAAGSLQVGVRAGEPPRIVVHTTPEQLAAARPDAPAAPVGSASCEQTGPITPTTLGLLSCDAVIDRVVLDRSGRVLELSTLGRFFTPTQRRALAARDGGCAFPGCDRPPSWTDAHHVIFWSDGGPTTVDNGVLVCEPHHTTVHLGSWRVEMHDGVPWFVPPRQLDPSQRPLRNSVHRAVTETRLAGQQLARSDDP